MKLKEYFKQNEFDLSLAAGFFGFYSHLGFVKALYENRLIPHSIYGSSAGAIIGSLFAAESDVSAIENKILSVKFSGIFDSGLGAGVIKGNRYHDLLAEMLPQDFSELKKDFFLSAFSLNDKKIKIISSGDLISSVRASSAFPGLFQPVKISDEIFLDGGIGDEFALSSRLQTRPLIVHGFSRFPLFQKSYSQLFRQNSSVYFFYADKRQSVGPFSMRRGEQIMNSVYLKTCTLLDTPIDKIKISEKSPKFISY